MFSGLLLAIIPTGIGKNRLAILKRNVEANGGKLCSDISEKDLNYVLIDDDLSPSHFPSSSGVSATIVKVGWLSECLKQKRRLDVDGFVVKPPTTAAAAPCCAITESGRKRAATESADDGAHMSPKVKQPRKKFVCEIASTSSEQHHQGDIETNQQIISQLQILANGYKSTNDKWRALSYEKAIQAVKNCKQRIATKEQVKALRGIGDSLATKIWEICQSGSLRKADEFQNNERIKVLNLFTNIWGVGPTTAEQWYVQGLRTLEDLQEKAKLTRQQKIGLKHYDDILLRMPRGEAAEIVATVKADVAKVNPSLLCEACGSYRRGSDSCGDVDILISHPDGCSHLPVIPILVESLTKQEVFLIDHLVESQDDETHKKYMGLCRLPAAGSLARRLDVISVPFNEYATSLLYFTGSAHFTRSIYAKAKSMGMRLNQHSLRGGVMRQHGEKLNDGYLIETPTEKSIFEALGIRYQLPEERNHL